MFKVLVLQRFHGLSDDAAEEQIFDRTSFKAFLGLRIGDDIPDAKTIWDFKQRIEQDGREGGRKLFDAFGQMLEGQGIIAREDSIIDASFTEAPRQRNDREANQRIKQGERPEEFDENPAVGRQKDREARWTKKNNEVHYGWKNHVKADLKTKLILTSTTTPASVHDSQVLRQKNIAKTRAFPAKSALITAAFSPEFQVGLSGDESTAEGLLMKSPCPLTGREAFADGIPPCPSPCFSR